MKLKEHRGIEVGEATNLSKKYGSLEQAIHIERMESPILVNSKVTVYSIFINSRIVAYPIIFEILMLRLKLVHNN